MPTPQRVANPSTFNDTTAPRIVRTVKRIHQRQTRSNTPMPTTPADDKVDTHNGWYDQPRSPRNERITAQPITPQKPAPAARTVQPATIFEDEPVSKDHHTRIPIISQDEEDIINSVPRGLGFLMTYKVPAPAPVQCSPRILPRFQQANTAIFCAQAALYEWIAHVMEAPTIFTPQKLQPAVLSSASEGNIDLQEFCGGVTHPETGATITSYNV